MLEEIKEQFTLDKFKVFVYDRFSNLVLETYPELNPTGAVFVIEIIVQSVLSVSVLFQAGIEKYWTNHEIATITRYSQYINLPNLYTTDFIDLIIQAVVIGILLLFLFLFVIFVGGWMPKTPGIVMAQFKRILQIFTIPYFHVVTYNWFSPDLNNIHYITKPLLTCIFILFFICMSVFIQFHFNPIPSKNNLGLRLSSDFCLYTFWLNFVKVLIYQYRGFDVDFVTVVLFLDLGKLYFIKEMKDSKIDYSQRLPEYLSVLTCIMILFAQFNDSFGFGAFTMWLIGIFLLLVQLIFKWVAGKQSNNLKVYDCLKAQQRQILLMVQQFIKKQWVGLSSSELSNYITYIFFHINRCNDPTCSLKQAEPTLRLINLNELQQHSYQIKSKFLKFMFSILEKYSMSSQLICTQHLILCHHTHQETKRVNVSPPNTICQEYIRYMIQQRVNCQNHTEDVDITLENYQQSKSLLLNQFNKTITSLKMFLMELKVKKPSLDVLIKHGYNAFNEIEDVKKLFMKILKSDFFDLRIIQIYMQFMVDLLKQQQLTEYISRVSKSKWLLSAHSLELLESSIPSLQIDPDENKILNMNSQAIKILKFHRMDIYDKKVSSFLHPFNQEESLRSLFDSLVMKGKFCFIKDSCDLNIPVIISAKTKSGTKDASIIEVQCLNKLKEDSFILITKSNQFIEAHPPHIGHQDICINLKQYYRTQLTPQIDQLHSAKFLNVQFQGHHVHATISDTIHSSYWYIKINIKRKIDHFVQRSFMNKNANRQLEFSPQIQIENNKITSISMNGQFKEIDDCSSEVSINIGDLETLAQCLVTEYKINYGEGIKSYRLDGDMIYNVELEEDNEEKAELIPEDRFVLKKQEDQHTRKKKIRIFYSIIFILSLIYIGVHILVIIHKLAILKAQETDHPLQTIMIFQNRFQRLFGVLRDQVLKIHYSTTTTWTTQIQNLFNSIQSSEKTLKFSKKMLSFPLLNVSYNSFLDYACNIFIAEIYRMSVVNNTDNFFQLNQKSMEYIDPAIQEEKALVFQNNLDQLSFYLFYHIFIICIHVFISALVMVFGLLINSQYRNEKESIMMPWRSLVDEEIQGMIDRLAVFEVQLMLSDKNEDVEVFGTLKQTVVYKTREYPRQFSQKSDVRNAVWLVGIIFFLLLGGGIHGFGLYTAYNQTTSIENSLSMNKQLPSTYIQLVKASKYNATITNETIINLNDIVNDVERLIPLLDYDQTFLNTFNLVMFQQHCNIMQVLLPNLTDCESFGQGFLYPNPLMMGYLVDLTALTFAMVTNVTNTYISSGIIGYVYELGITFFLDLLMNSKIQMIQKFYASQMGYIITSVILCLLIMIIILLVYATSIAGLERIEQVSRLLNISADNKRIKLDKKKGKQYQSIPDSVKDEV